MAYLLLEDFAKRGILLGCCYLYPLALQELLKTKSLELTDDLKAWAYKEEKKVGAQEVCFLIVKKHLEIRYGYLKEN